MRILLLSLAMAALSGCATTPAPTPSSAPAVAPPATTAPAPTHIGQLLAAAGSANAPTQADIERAMGAADITRHDGAGVALTYRLDHCALLLVFGADAQNQQRLSDVHSSARIAGDAAPNIDQCAAEATARHP